MQYFQKEAHFPPIRSVKMISNEINDWLKERPKWIQSAADYYIKFGVFDDESIDRFATLCLEEADN